MAENKGNREHKKREERFTHALNQHGYAFQNSVKKVVRHLFDDGESDWRFEAEEYPVEVQGYGTRIDLILKGCARHGTELPVFLICECKRANPALADWCFCRSSFVMHGRQTIRQLIADCVDMPRPVFNFGVFAVRAMSGGELSKRVYDIPIPVKTDKKGDTEGEGRKAIENAATQALRGVNGYIEHLNKYSLRTPHGTRLLLVPVVFTTAHLYTSDVELDSADIETGEVSQAELQRVPWLVWQYHVSPGLKHSVQPTFKDSTDVCSVLESEFIRSLFVVNALGIKEFLKWLRQEDLHFDPTPNLNRPYT